MANKTWAERFFEEKQIPYKEWTIYHNDTQHFIDNDFVIEIIKGLSPAELKQVKNMLIKIDFANGNVNHFLEHLANGYVKTNY